MSFYFLNLQILINFNFRKTYLFIFMEELVMLSFQKDLMLIG